MQDEGFDYYSSQGFVYTAEHALELAAVWDGIDEAERGGIPLDQIGLALTNSWSAVVVALAFKNTTTLIAEARS